MKKVLLMMLVLLVVGQHQSKAQSTCTPVDCLDSLLAAGGLPLGGLCGDDLIAGQVGVPYSTTKTVSFRGACFNAREIQPDFPLAVPVRLTNVSNIRFSNFPEGLIIQTNAASYTVPNNGRNAGCAGFDGIPTQAGVFEVRLDVTARVQPCVPLIPALNQEADFSLSLTILPDASFSGVPAVVNVTDEPYTLFATGTQGGVFSGPGVAGNIFDPSTLTPGSYTITYTVSAKEGAAIDFATNSASFTVEVEPAPAPPTCVPVDCLDSLRAAGGLPIGGLCGDDLPVANVGRNYSTIKSVAFGGACFNAREIQPDFPLAVPVRLTNVSNIRFSNFPDGLTLRTNAAAYTVPNNGRNAGCADIFGTPTQSGIFEIRLDVTARVQPCVPLIPALNQEADFSLLLTVLPNARFEGVPAVVSNEDEPFSLTVLGNEGGVFSGAGVSGNIFDPRGLAPGTYEITYTVSAKEGAAVDSATNSFTIVVEVEGDDVLPIFTFFTDKDGDGLGDPNDSIVVNTPETPEGFVDNDLDCNDNDPEIGAAQTWFADVDGDGLGDPDSTTEACEQPEGFVANSDDCDDTNVEIGAGITWFADADGDGLGDPNNTTEACQQPEGFVANSDDCDDTNAEIGNGIIWFADADGDGLGDPDSTTEACEQPDGFVANSDDCDDTNAEIGAVQTWFADADNDGLGDPNSTTEACEQPVGFVANSDDCDDTNAEIGAAKTWFADADGDGFGDPNTTTASCEQPAGFLANSDDCDDSDAKTNPGTIWYADRDNDGFTSHETQVQCERPEGFKTFTELSGTQLDPDDNDPEIKPDVIVTPGGGICNTSSMVTISNVSATGFTVSFSSVENAIVYKAEIRTGGGNWLEAGLSTGTTISISSLNNCTEYDIRIIAICACGISEPSEPVTIETDGCVVINDCAVPAGLTAERRTFNTVTARWSPVSGAQSYNVRIRPVGTQAWNTVNVTATDRIFSGLNIFRIFEIQVQAVCGGTTSDWSESITYDPRSGAVSTLRQLRLDPNFDESTGSFRVMEDAASITAYPNPVQGTLYVTYVGKDIENAVISIVDASGRQLRSERMGRLATTTFDVNVSGLAPGMYFLQIQNGEEMLPTQTIIVK